MGTVDRGCLIITIGEWVNVSSGTGHPGSPVQRAIKWLCVSKLSRNKFLKPCQTQTLLYLKIQPKYMQYKDLRTGIQ